MGLLRHITVAAIAATSFLASTVVAQASNTPTPYTEPTTGIPFQTWQITNEALQGDDTDGTVGGMTWGVALPPNSSTVDAKEFIGYLQCASNKGLNTGWCGMSFGGGMTNSLLLVAWPYQGQILTSFRYATAYAAPDVYAGNATLTQISSTVNATHYTLMFRCQNCLAWSQDGVPGSVATSSAFWLQGWAQANVSPVNPSCPNNIVVVEHDNGENLWPTSPDATWSDPNYAKHAALATKTVTGSCGSTAPTGTASATTTVPTATATPVVSGLPAPTQAFDYIIVGGGAGGIPLADKLSEAGHSVLLIEKGPASSGRYNGNMKPDWLDGTNLTRFDVPGLCNEIWVNSTGVSCTDTDQMAGCVLGGGTAVNAGLWWNPNPVDWDLSFPTGWQSKDMAAASARVFNRIPGTYTPSKDGQLYYHQGFNVLANGLKQGGWSSVVANSVPGSKNHTYSVAPFMFINGERGGPLATYLVTANARKNFKMILNTSVKRIIRTGGHATGVELEPFLAGGYSGIVNLTAVTGRVVASAGTFGSAKLLMRSGIGPADQLANVLASKDGPSMISNSSWINLPVGYNLNDHVNTDTVVTHPDVVFYDFYQAWTAPNTTDASNYLNKRTGILAQAAPNIGPMFWDEIKGADGITRQLQWTARVEGSDGTPNGKAMTMSQYLGRGSVSRGRMTITTGLNTIVSTVPYLHDANDVAAVIQGIKNLQAALKGVSNLTWTYPPANQTVEDFVNTMVVATSNRRANHWIGTNKMGADDGRVSTGTAVVDLNTKVYGTDNIFVVDASIFPAHITTNPTSYIMSVAEQAAVKIQALAFPTAQAQYAQCGGQSWTGSIQCAGAFTCKAANAYYSQCL